MVDEAEFRFAVEHFRRREAAHALARDLVSGIEHGKFKLPGTREERETYAARAIESLKALRGAGRLTLPEFVQQAGFYAISIVSDYREFDGDYEAELAPISQQIRAVERAHGLSEDETWLKHEGPPEWQALNTEYEATVYAKQLAVLREFGLHELAGIMELEPEQFHNLWVRATDSAEKYLPGRERLVQMIASYRDESARAEAAGAFHAAAATRGAALEGMLLLRCVDRPSELERALSSLPERERPRGSPTQWTLGTLVRVSRQAGWLPRVVHEQVEFDAGTYAELVTSLRNLLHPGRRLASPETELTAEELADARAALVVVETVLENLDEQS